MSGKLFKVLLVTIVAGALFAGICATAAASNAVKPYAESELLVKFKPSTNDDTRKQVHAKFGSQALKSFRFLRIDHIKLKQGETVSEAIAKYAADKHVEYAEPNYYYKADTIPNDTSFKDQWGLNNTGQNGGTVDADIDAPEAWNITTGNAGVIVADIDTGLDNNHRDLSTNVWTNPGEVANNGRDDDNNGYVDDIHGINAFNGDTNTMDDNGHGTHTAGTIGALSNNRRGVAGVNWNVKIIVCKFLSADGYGSTEGAIECLEYIRALKARGENIVASNNSWGGGEFSQALLDAIDAQRNILFIAAAGNDATDNDDPNSYTHFPSSYYLPNIIAVAATDNKETLAYFSNYGRRTVHVGAPGVDILSTTPYSSYETHSGTSMATPHVTGLAALLKAQNGNRDWRAIKNLILAGGDNTAAMTAKTITSKRINAYGSLTCVATPIFSVLKCPTSPSTGVPQTISCLSIKGANASGPVTVQTYGGTVTLLDDGINSDMAAGDGIFTGTWIPAGEGSLTFTSPAGSEMIFLKPLVILTEFLPGATIGKPYSKILKGEGGLLPYNWSITAGSLPAGLSLNSATGEISGIPTATGTAVFTIQLADRDQSTTKELSIATGFDQYLTYDSGGEDNGNSIATDSSGNVIVTGSVTSGYSSDILTIKYDTNGHVVWTKTLDLGTQDAGHGVAVDGSGNIYITGIVGDGINTNNNAITIKYSPNGDTLWTATYDSGYTDNGEDVAVDSLGNVYMTGAHGRTAYTADTLTVKYDPNGNVIWSRTMYVMYGKGGGIGIGVDANGNVAVADYNDVHRYDAAGNLLWTKALSNMQAFTLTVDGNGLIYISGCSNIVGTYDTDVVTIKYDTAGSQLWSRTYARTFRDSGNGITVDTDGNVWVVGSVIGGGNYDYLTMKYDASGALLLDRTYDGKNGEEAKDVTIDSVGNVCVTGSAHNGIDNDILTIIYSAASDTVPPVVTAFDVPANSSTLAVPVNVFTGTDNVGVTGYLLTETPEKPNAAQAGWTPTAPASYTFGSEGSKTLYAWVRDLAGNVSSSLLDTVTVTLPINTIVITKAEYNSRTVILTVYATSANGANAALQVLNFGPMTWNIKQKRWELVRNNLYGAPTTVTVFGPEGSATSNVTVH